MCSVSPRDNNEGEYDDKKLIIPDNNIFNCHIIATK